MIYGFLNFSGYLSKIWTSNSLETVHMGFKYFQNAVKTDYVKYCFKFVSFNADNSKSFISKFYQTSTKTKLK